MDTREATDLIRDAIPTRGGTWADLGAGDGTFTRALVNLVGPRRIYAVDSDARAMAELMRWGTSEPTEVIPVVADFTRLSDLPALNGGKLDGMLLANSLHYVSEPAKVLSRLIAWLRPRGRVVLIEYDRREADRWVPYPIPVNRWKELSRVAGLSAPIVTATRPSVFGGDLYVAAADVEVNDGE
jgi:ubiquinone/menaquinone biosynthesis C-methylase UbiE